MPLKDIQVKDPSVFFVLFLLHDYQEIQWSTYIGFLVSRSK